MDEKEEAAERRFRAIAEQLHPVMSEFANKAQSLDEVCPVRLQVIKEIGNVLWPLKQSGEVERFEVVCDRMNNTDETILKRETHVDVQLKLSGWPDAKDIYLVVTAGGLVLA